MAKHSLPVSFPARDRAIHLPSPSRREYQTPCNPARQNANVSGPAIPPHAQWPICFSEITDATAPSSGANQKIHPDPTPRPSRYFEVAESRSSAASDNNSAPQTAPQYSIHPPRPAETTPPSVSSQRSASTPPPAAKMPASCSCPPAQFRCSSKNIAARTSLPVCPRNSRGS
jgi:hypothetical protein